MTNASRSERKTTCINRKKRYIGYVFRKPCRRPNCQDLVREMLIGLRTTCSVTGSNDKERWNENKPLIKVPY